MDGAKYAFPLTGENVLMDFVVSLTIGVDFAENLDMGHLIVERQKVLSPQQQPLEKMRMNLNSVFRTDVNLYI